MRLKYVESENILSIGHVRLDFDDNGLVLLDGRNHDDDSANGAGKTACFLPISFAIWNKFPRKMTVSEILRKGTKKGFTKVGIEASNGDFLEVARYRPNKVEYFVNGVEVEMSQEEFEDRVGLTYNQYLICMYSAQTEGKRLIGLNDSEMKDFILQLMNLEKFSIYKKEADKKTAALELKKNDLQTVVTQCDSKIEVYREQLVDADDIEKEIGRLSVTDLQDKLNKYSAITKPDISKFIDLRSKIQDKLKALDESDINTQSLRLELGRYDKQLSDLQKTTPLHVINCPECSTELTVSSSGADSLASYREKRNKEEEGLRTIKKSLIEQIKASPNTTAQREELNKLSARSYEAQDKAESEYNNALQYISELKSKIALRTEKINTLKNQLSRQQEAVDKIAELKSIRDKSLDRIKQLDAQIETYKTVSAIFAPTGAPAYIMDSVVDIFNEKITDYISTMWSSASYSLQSFKENKSGDVKAKFSNKLTINGRDRSIGSLSGGEYKCLSLAMDFAMMDVLESVFGFQMSPIVLDEPFEGLDASNRERAIALLEKKALERQIWVIDHASEVKTMFSKIICIEKRNGVSSLVI